MLTSPLIGDLDDLGSGGRIDDADGQRRDGQRKPHGVVEEQAEDTALQPRLLSDDQVECDQVEDPGNRVAGPARAAVRTVTR